MGNLERALFLREKKEFEKSNRILMDMAKQNPGDAVIQYQCAWSLDILGLEVKAVPYYEAALELGLPEEDAKGAYLGLGSTYRTIGEYEKNQDGHWNPDWRSFLGIRLYWYSGPWHFIIWANMILRWNLFEDHCRNLEGSRNTILC